MICLALTGFAFNSGSGLLTPDTKLDLDVDPAAFLARSLHLWDAQGFAGQTQDQAYGYLFPMGPFFLAGHAVGLPAWVVQRSWWSLLLCVAFLGVVRLARALGLGSSWSRLLAGVAYAASPHILSLLGTNSVEILPMCVAPWIVLPLVLGSRSGASARRAGLLCGLAVLCMGGVNAAADLAAVVPAALWLLTRRVSRDSIRLALWAVAGAVLATLWWVVPLLLLGRYSPPFLDYIENARITTSTTALAETLRGTSDWVSYLPTDGNPAGRLLLTQPVLVLESLLVVAFGLAGIALRRTPHRVWLVACLAFGLVAVTFGHGASIGSVAAAGERSMLDTLLAPLRNIHKFDVLIRLPLVLGLAHVVPRLRWGRTVLDRRVTSRVGAAVVAIAVIGTATPLLALRLNAPGSFTALPTYWRSTASWLHRHDGDRGRALLLPASRFGQYAWGSPLDEPLQALASSPWEVRNAIPMTSPGHIRMLDAVETALADGAGSPDLAAYLARTGIRYLVVRNDLDVTGVSATEPVLVAAALTASPGIQVVKNLGPPTGIANGQLDQGLRGSFPSVQIYRVSAPGEGDARVTTATTGSTVRLSGGPESLLSTPGVVAQGRPAVLAGQPGDSLGSTVVLTDGNRRQEVNYGGPVGQRSATLTATDDGRLRRRVMNYLAVDGVRHQSVVRFVGARDVTASSSASDATNATAPEPSAQPYAASDRDPRTAWQPAVGTAPVGQWLRVDLDGRPSLSSVTVTQSAAATQRITELRVTTQRGSSDVAVPAGNGAVAVPVPSGPTSFLRLEIAAVRGPLTGHVGVTAVDVPGVRIGRTLVLPRDTPRDRAVDTVALSAGPARTGCPLLGNEPYCAAGLARLGEDDAGLDRSFTTGRGAAYRLGVAVVPTAGSALDALIARNARYALTATASSSAVDDPLAAPQTAVDGDTGTGWIAASTDRDPSITLRWKQTRSVGSLKVVKDDSLAATRPDALRITDAKGQSVLAAVEPDGSVRFPALRTNRLTVHLLSGTGLRTSVDSSVGPGRLGLGLSEIRVPGVATTSRAATENVAVHLRCGSGPSVVIDDAVVQTSVDTTVGALRDRVGIEAHPCGTSDVTLAAGGHRVTMASSALFTAASVTLQRRAATTSAGPAASVRSWGSTARSVHLAARSSSALLVVNENVNAGWHATAGGHTLRAVAVDGWRQAYVVPAGAATTVHLTYGPQTEYAAGLIVGAVAVAVLLGLLLVPARRRRATDLGSYRPDVVTTALGAAAAVLVGGYAGLAVAVLVPVAGALVVRLVTGVVAGPRARAAVVPALAAAAAVLAGLRLAVGHYGTTHYVADSASTQLLCLIAVVAATSGGLVTRLSRRPGAASGPTDAATGRADADSSPGVRASGTPDRPPGSSTPG